MSASVATSTAPREPMNGNTAPNASSTQIATRCWRAPSAGALGKRTALVARTNIGLTSWNTNTTAAAIHTGRQCWCSTT